MADLQDKVFVFIRRSTRLKVRLIDSLSLSRHADRYSSHSRQAVCVLLALFLVTFLFKLISSPCILCASAGLWLTQEFSTVQTVCFLRVYVLRIIRVCIFSGFRRYFLDSHASDASYAKQYLSLHTNYSQIDLRGRFFARSSLKNYKE